MKTYKKGQSSDDRILQIGGEFGTRVAALVGTVRTIAVTVQSVEDKDAMVTIYENDTPLPVPLTFLSIEDGFLKVTPSIGSLSVIAFLNGDENKPFFVQHSKIDKFEFTRSKSNFTWSVDEEDDTKDELSINVGTSKIRIVDSLIEFNEGNHKGTVLIEALTTRLNKLQSELDTFIQTYNGHTHPFNYLGGAVASAGVSMSTTSTGTPPSTFSISEYENQKITQ